MSQILAHLCYLAVLWAQRGAEVEGWGFSPSRLPALRQDTGVGPEPEVAPAALAGAHLRWALSKCVAHAGSIPAWVSP